VVPFAIKEFIIDGSDSELQKDAEEVWKKEVATLDELSGLTHDNLIQRIASITRGRQRLLMFLWADGGNLRDFWGNWPVPKITADLVRDIIKQLRGMAHALQALHEWGKKQALQQSQDSSSEYHYRHGDIKPENILCFPDPDGSEIGRLVISDLGSAQHHSVATRLRERTGDKAWATKMYEPPESETKKLDASSRRYDIWSMGCVTMEFMVWLLYGFEELTNFRTSIEGEKGVPASFFMVHDVPLQGPEGIAFRKVAKIHRVVENRLDLMSHDPRCTSNTALGELLGIIKTKLLVVKIPEYNVSPRVPDNVIITSPDDDPNIQTYQTFGYHRASASEFVNALDFILQQKNTNYWLTDQRNFIVSETFE
jgi:serine/threonine protein kinase